MNVWIIANAVFQARESALQNDESVLIANFSWPKLNSSPPSACLYAKGE